MKDRVAKSPGRYSAQVSPEDFNNLQTGKAFPITLVRDDDPEVEGTPYSKAAVLPDSIAEVLCPGVEDPTPADAFAALADCSKNMPLVYTATPDTLANVIKTAVAGATVQLTAGEYGLLKLHGQNAYPEGCTFIGCEGATVAGVSISSGVLSSDQLGCGDVEKAILAQGLTFKDVAFTDNFSLRNARVDNLTIDHCSFANAYINISPECFTDKYGDDLGTGSTSVYRFPYAQLNQKNLIIRNCRIDGSQDDTERDDRPSAIIVVGVDNVTVHQNEIIGNDAADPGNGKNIGLHNGIQIGGHIDTYSVVSSGKVVVTKNSIEDTKSRGINVHSVYGGEVTVAENAMKTVNIASTYPEGIAAQLCKDTTFVWMITGSYKYNTNDGINIQVNNGIRLYNITGTKDAYNNQPKTYIVSSPSKLASTIAEAEPGATIKLTKADYGLLSLTGNTSYPENLTIIGEDGVNIAGITVSSGVRHEHGTEQKSVTMPKGLTVKGLNFTGNFYLLNSEMRDLSILDCNFDGKSAVVCKPQALDAGGSRDGAYGTMLHNVLVRGCTFATGSDRDYAINLYTVDGAVIENNTIDGAKENGIHIASNYGYKQYTCGRIVFKNNKISNTTKEGIKFWFIRDAEVYVIGNTLTNTSNPGIYANNCASTVIAEDANTLNGAATVISQSSVSSPATYIKTLIGFDAALKEKANKTALEAHQNLKTNPHGVTAAQVGAHPNTWMPTAADVGAAPAGHGLGQETGYLPSVTKEALDNTFTAGWYQYYNLDVFCCGYPGTQHGGILVVPAMWGCAQYFFCRNFLGGVLKRTYINSIDNNGKPSEWTPWEYVNPPMISGAEYRTTERWNGKVVWTVLLALGSVGEGVFSETTSYESSCIIDSRATAIHSSGITYSLPHLDLKNGYHITANVHTTNSGNITITGNITSGFGGGVSNLTVQVWYTKD